MAPPNPGLPTGHPSLPANPYGQQPQQPGQAQQPQPQMAMQYLQMQMAMQQQLMQSQAYGYGGYYNPQMMMRQNLFQPVSYQPVQNEQGYTYSSTYLEQQQQQQQPPQSQTPTPSTLPPTTLPSPSGRPTKKPRTQPTAPTDGTGGAWRNCVQDGCAFVGSEKDVALHEQDRHLIYKKRVVERSEEEEAALRKAGPAPPIPGTAIRLETEEDIAKWIAQRRARWPTAARVEEREKERQEKIARGEIDPSASGRGRRGRGGRTGTRGGRGRGASEAGTSARTRDAGYQQRSQPPANGTAKKEMKQEEDSGSDSSDSSDSDSDEGSDVKPEGSAPRPMAQEDVRVVQSPPSTKRERGICKFFAKTGKCRNGTRCHFLHERQGQRQDSKLPRTQPSSAFTLTTSANRPSLLAALLENPINQTLSSISQALQFLVDNDFLDGVELNPGEFEQAQTQDAAATRKLVQMLDTDQKPPAEEVPMSAVDSVEDKTEELMHVDDAPDEGAEATNARSSVPDGNPTPGADSVDEVKTEAPEADVQQHDSIGADNTEFSETVAAVVPP